MAARFRDDSSHKRTFYTPSLPMITAKFSIYSELKGRGSEA